MLRNSITHREAASAFGSSLSDYFWREYAKTAAKLAAIEMFLR
jgi:hypothetical protein